MKSLLIVVVIVVECFSLAHTTPSGKPIVETKYGKIIGKTRHFLSEDGHIKYVNTFLGVPYASPPIKDLRFQPPKPPHSWKPEIYNATSFKFVCAQSQSKYFLNSIRLAWPGFTWEKDSSEDCLYLNIFAPGRENATNSSPLYPVIMFLHGGSYVHGTTARHTTPGEVFPRFGVVLVMVQYRLGPFGFMTTGDAEARGNWGMLDQVQALKWIRENIKAFGGDPERVTALGVSSGGASVGLHLLSPLSEGLFQRAIIESGVELSPFAFQSVEAAVQNTKKTAKNLSCNTEDHREMMNCLKTKDTSQIVDKWQGPTRPVIDNHFICDTPEKLRLSGQFHPVPLIGGFNSDEAGHNIPQKCIPPNELSSAVFGDCIKSFVHKEDLYHNNEKTAGLLEDSITFQYTPWTKTPDPPTLLKKIVNMQSDYFVAAPTLKVLEIHSQKAPTYMYEFSHISKRSSEEAWLGVRHGANTPYDFGAPFLNISSLNFTEEDRNVSSFIMSLYANFAKDGIPTPSALHGVTWNQFNRTHKSYLLIQENPEMQTNFEPQRMAFWNFYYPRLLNFSKTIANSKEQNRDNHNNGVGRVSKPGLLGLILIVLCAPVLFD